MFVSCYRFQMAIGAKQRFEILKRDDFKCRYCGAGVSSGAVMHVDHVVPRSKGGYDGDTNLVAACSDCNLGKAANELSPEKVMDIRAFNISDSNRQILDAITGGGTISDLAKAMRTSVESLAIVPGETLMGRGEAAYAVGELLESVFLLQRLGMIKIETQCGVYMVTP